MLHHTKYFVTAWFLMTASASCASNSDPQGTGGSTSGNPTSANSTGTGICAEGEGCDLNQEFCCSGKTILQCNGGQYVQHAFCSGDVEDCVNEFSVCTCTQGDIGCLNSTTEQRCIAGDTGQPFVLNLPCGPGQTCQTGTGCGFCTDKCVVGTRTCEPNTNVVLECRRVPPDNCALMVPVVSCRDEKMDVCDPTASANTAIEFCVNECGGRGYPLPHRVCAPGTDGDPPCAVYLCDGMYGIKTDHVGCLPGGSPCSFPEICVSCSCQGGVCIGSTKAFCGGALQQCAN